MDRISYRVLLVAGILACLLLGCGIKEAEKRKKAEELVGKCAYNPSDMRYLGRVVRIHAVDVDSYGDRAPGQITVVVKHVTADQEVKATYPKYLVVKECGN